jgi:Outer membrane lipoprotein-sorting protein
LSKDPIVKKTPRARRALAVPFAWLVQIVPTVLILAAPVAALAAGDALSQGQSAALLQDSDRYRGGVRDGGQWQVQLDSSEAGSARTSQYFVKAKGVNALVECLSPAKNKGELMLFEDRALWFYKPALRKPIGLSVRQRLVGQAANGDIAATNYARDYDVTAVTVDTVDGHATWVLDLKAKTKSVTYDRIRYWIDKQDHLGIKAEFLTVQGEVFKRARFEYANEVQLAGKRVPFVSKMVITSATFADAVTTIVYRTPEVRAIPDSVFNVDALVR